MRRFAIALLAWALSSAAAGAAEPELSGANRLFLEAAALYQQAEAAGDPDRRSAGFAEARERLERILAEHPESHLALLLASGEPVAGLSLPLARASAELARLQAVNLDKLLAELERSQAATKALRGQNDSMRAAMDQETARVTALLIEQNELRAALAQRPAAAESDTGARQQLDAALVEIDALKQQKASITALLTSERDKSAALQQQVQTLTAAAQPAGETQEAALTAEPAEPAPGSAAPKISAEEIAAAIKEALALGTERVVAQVGQADGYYANPEIRIPLPGSLGQVAEMLSAVGLGALTDDVELRMNRAAEQAAPQAAGIFGQAIAAMQVEDIEGIMNGPDDAATRYFEGAMSLPLADALRPVIEQAMAEAGAVQAYDDMIGKYKAIPLVPDVKADLTEHTLQAAMKGLFFYLAREEAAIRNDAVKRTTALLQKVFGI